MLALCLGVLSATVLLGVSLALARGGVRPMRLARPAAALHGLLGAAGLAALVPVLQGPPRGAAMGAGSFGAAAAVLLAAALLTGFVLLAAYAAMPA